MAALSTAGAAAGWLLAPAGDPQRRTLAAGADRWRGDAANSWPLGFSLPPWARACACAARGEALRHALRLGGALGHAAPGDVVRFCLRAWQRRQPSRVMCVG